MPARDLTEARVREPDRITEGWAARKRRPLAGDDGRLLIVAAGLGATSRHTWLKLPVVDDLPRVMDATTLPTLLLGGDPTGHPDETYAAWDRALHLPAVRGLVVGRALLFPPDGDVTAAVDTAAGLVHTSLDPSRKADR